MIVVPRGFEGVSRVPMTVAAAVRAAGRRLRALAGEAGEGVISTAIAILVMAFIGVAMWVAFDRILGDTATAVDTQVDRIGSSGAAGGGGNAPVPPTP